MTRDKNTKRRPWPPKTADLEALIEEAIVDAYGESEQRTAFYTMLEKHLGVPFEAEILGVAATVEGIDMTDDEQIVAICRRGRSRQEGKRGQIYFSFFAGRPWPRLSTLTPSSAIDLINKPFASSELPALQGLSNESQL